MKHLFSIPGFIVFLIKELYNMLVQHYSLYRLKKANPTVTFGKGVIIKNAKSLKLGKNIFIGEDTFLHCGGMEWCNFSGGIDIGDNAYIGARNVIWGTGAKIYIKNDVTTAQNVHIYASTEYRKSFNQEGNRKRWFKFNDVIIEEGAGIYSMVTIGPGITIGAEARVSANSLVLKNVEASTLVSGNPARFVKKIIT